MNRGIAAGEAEGLLEYLSLSRGFDITAYKRNTLLRRIQKRMNEVGADSLADYQDRLQVNPDEFIQLFNTILINVTSFFRDPEQWEYLAKNVLPDLLTRRPGQSELRIWSAGCASGQEAYSAAMQLAEVMGVEALRKRVKIYATDVDDDALAKARSGSFTASEAESLPEVLRTKYFDSSGGRYIFRQDLRRSLIFGRHDLLQDAPISRIDLLLCRNTLMYFTPEVQTRVLSRLHYALNSDGVLFLGRAEMLLTHGELFRPVDPRARAFTKIRAANLRERFAIMRNAGDASGATAVQQRDLLELASDYAPYGQLIVSDAGVLLSANVTARSWFGLVEADVGRPLQDLEVSYRPIDLRTLIDRAETERRVVSVQNVERLSQGNLPIYFDIAVTSLRDGDRFAGASILFSNVTNFHQLRHDLERSQHELETAYEELQSTNEELETTNEELQSTIEELETTNEELQSSNEELETMNEELESTNSELQALNQELSRRTDEIDKVNAFVTSVMGSLQLGVIVVDSRLQVEMWNQHSEELWGVRSEEAVGQALANLDIGLPIPETLQLIKKTLRGEGPTEEVTVEATNRRGRSISCRMLASRLPLDGDDDGVILLLEQLRAR